MLVAKPNGSNILKIENLQMFFIKTSQMFEALVNVILIELKLITYLNPFQRDSAFSLIAEVIVEGLEVDPVESYFITKRFYRFSEEISNELPKLKQYTISYLEKEEEDIYR